MTIETTASAVTYTGNGATTAFSYAFLIPEADDVVVSITDLTSYGVTVVPSNQYSITGLGDRNGGSVTYPLTGSPLSSGYSLSIQRVLPEVQTTVLNNQGAMYPTVIEDALDYLTMLIQQLEEELGRAVIVPIGTPVSLATLAQIATEAAEAAAQATAAAALIAGSYPSLVGVGGAEPSNTSGVAYLRTSGYYTVGDGGGGLYAKVGGPTDYTFESADGYFYELRETKPNPRQFGAKGDDSTDDLTSVQLCLDYCYDNALSMWPTGGIYRLSDAVEVRCSVFGDSSWLAAFKTTAADKNVFNLTTEVGVTIKGIRITRSATPSTGYGIYVDSGSGDFQYFTTIDNCFISGLDGIRFNRVNSGIITSCQIIDFPVTGIWIANVDYPDNGDNTIVGNTLDTSVVSAQACIYQTNAGGSRIIGNKLGRANLGIQLEFDGLASTSILLIADNSIENQNTGCIFLRQLSGAAVFLYVIITGNEMGGVLASNGVVNLGGTTFYNCIVSDNIIVVGATSGPLQYGININEAQNVYVHGNILNGADGIGINALATATGRIGPNKITGFTTAVNNLSSNVLLERWTQAGVAIVNINTTVGGLFYGDVSFNFAVPFQVAPSMSAIPVGSEGLAAALIAASVNSASFRVYALVNSTSVPLSWTAFGG
jgi:hypothetical protein